MITNTEHRTDTASVDKASVSFMTGPAIRLVQIQNPARRAVAIVGEPYLCLLSEPTSVMALAQEALSKGQSLRQLTAERMGRKILDYDSVYRGESEWKLISPIDRPEDLSRCIISGTGLTHWGSAKNRAEMHQVSSAEMTDSMRMFQWGKERGRPEAGKIGIAPEWFYKGTGANLRAHGEALEIPAYAEDGGEEAEVAGIYMIGPDGTPWRIGMATGNEFSDHVFERKNYLNLAGSKMRTCAIGPELVIAPEFQSVPGRARIERNGGEIWAKDIRTGEQEMTHSLANIEHHHFKFEAHRRPGDVHVHFFGAHSLSFGDKVQIADGDVMEISFQGFGRPLRNPVRVAEGPEALVKVSALD